MTIIFPRCEASPTTPACRGTHACPAYEGDPDISQQPHAYGFSSHLKRLASASQPGVKALAQTSWVLSATTASLSPDLPTDPPEGQLVF